VSQCPRQRAPGRAAGAPPGRGNRVKGPLLGLLRAQGALHPFPPAPPSAAPRSSAPFAAPGIAPRHRAPAAPAHPPHPPTAAPAHPPHPRTAAPAHPPHPPHPRKPTGSAAS